VVTTENGGFFNDDFLKRFNVVVWLSTTGDGLIAVHKRHQPYYEQQPNGAEPPGLIKSGPDCERNGQTTERLPVEFVSGTHTYWG